MKNRYTILIADDSEMNRAILADMLGDEYTVIEAQDGMEAINIFRERAADIDLLLLDIMMPELDGFGVLEAMRKYGWIGQIPVVMISAESSANFVERAYEMGATDYISRPFEALVVRRRVINTLMLFEKQKRLVQMVAEQVYEKEKTSNRMIAILSHIVEFRNGESGLHVVHIRSMTELLCRHLVRKTDRYPMTPEDIVLYGTASALHDIGKISIPESILNKPGKLTPEEFEIIKTHSAVGAKMLKSISETRKDPLITIAHDICRWHHERWDGRGYPDGLKGEEIPISAQIVALADVYDALTSERCYKKAFPHEKAVEMILNGECGAFNPLLLECLTEVSGQLKEEMQWNGNSAWMDEPQTKIKMDELLKSNELEDSGKIFQLIEQEREKARFFASTAEEIQFTYNALTSMVSLSNWASKRLGLDQTFIDPQKRDQSFMGKEKIGELAEALHQTTPEKPDVKLEVMLPVDGSLRWHRVHARSLWTGGTYPEYMGAVGKIIDIHDKYTSEFKNGADTDASGENIVSVIQKLAQVFDEVRIIDVHKAVVLETEADGTVRESPHCCYHMWKRTDKCENCISDRAFQRKERLCKLEFTDSHIYQVIAKYVEIGKKPYVLEMVNRIEDMFLMDVKEKGELTDKILNYNQALYKDSLTGVYNRRYYEEKMDQLEGSEAVAMIDVDNFKRINDTFGHIAGDRALKAIAQAINTNVRRSDILIRYGGDEFLLIFPQMGKEWFEDKLEHIRQRVETLFLEEYPEMKLSISLGGVYSGNVVRNAVDAADRLMYKAKKLKNTVKIQA